MLYFETGAGDGSVSGSDSAFCRAAQVTDEISHVD
jgi:hypothetical protein